MQYQVRQKKFQKGNEHPKFYVIKRSFRFALLKMFSAPPACAENIVFIVNILKSLSKQLLIMHKKRTSDMQIWSPQTISSLFLLSCWKRMLTMNSSYTFSIILLPPNCRLFSATATVLVCIFSGRKSARNIRICLATRCKSYSTIVLGSNNHILPKGWMQTSNTRESPDPLILPFS